MEYLPRSRPAALKGELVLMQHLFLAHRLGLRGTDFFAAHDSDRMDCRVDITAPVIQEFVQFGILRGEVIELPHETLDQDRMIRQVIQNLCGGQPITFQLQC